MLLVAALGYAAHSMGIQEMQGRAQRILDDNLENNALAADVINAPWLAFVPFVGPREWRSYLFLTGKDGRALDLKKCPATADYEMTVPRSTNTHLKLKPSMRVYFERLQECSDALQANGDKT